VYYEFKTSFDRRFKKLSSPRQQKVYQAIDTLMKHIDGETGPPPGLGLKNWHADYWEIRAGARDRILFEFTDQITFLFIGNHDDIRDFMKGK
jgi:mRNA-degrading endonuclease RelE of RelBE toxin-antitoxin system